MNSLLKKGGPFQNYPWTLNCLNKMNNQINICKIDKIYFPEQIYRVQLKLTLLEILSPQERVLLNVFPLLTVAALYIYTHYLLYKIYTRYEYKIKILFQHERMRFS